MARDLLDVSLDRYYLRGSKIDVEEDDEHEFKGHRTIRMSHMSKICIINANSMTRQPISRTINAFLNTGKGGTIYLGVLDNGLIEGLHLSSDQMVHVVKNIEQTIKLFDPPVSMEEVRVKFVPAVSSEEEFKDLKEKGIKLNDANRIHNFGSSAFCWCDLDDLHLIGTGSITMPYVVEIEVLPSLPVSSFNNGISLYKIYENEERLIYIRRQAINLKQNISDIINLTKKEVNDCIGKLMSTCGESVY